MWIRGHRLLGAAAVALVCAWSATAHASWSMSPGTINTPPTDVGVESGAATGTLSGTGETGNPKVDIVASATCTGTGSGTFSFTPDNNIAYNSLPTMITVKYTPTTAGPYSCTVNVYAHGTTTVVTTFTATGDGQRPPMISVGTLQPMSPFPTVRAFDNAVAASTSTRTLTVTNTGDRDLNITNVTFTGTNGSDFSIDSSSANTTTATIAGGAAKTWTLKFNPGGIGTRSGTITFASNSTSGTNTASLSGSGSSGAFTISAGAGNGVFGQVAVNSTATLDITVTHSGASPKGTLTFSTASVTGSSWFTITAQPTTLDGTTQMGTVTVQCLPTAIGTQNATVTVTADSDGSAGPGYVTSLTQMVSCEGAASELAFMNGSSIDFDPQLVNFTSNPAKTLELTNTGNADALVWFTSTAANRNRFAVTGPGNCGTMMAMCTVPKDNGKIMISATFSPVAEGSVSAGFSVTQMAAVGAPPGFTLNGRGIDRHFAVPESVQFEDTFRNPGSKATVSPVVVENKGEFPVLISELTINGDNEVWQVIDPPVPFMVDGLGTRDILVRFAPHVAGKADDGQLLVVNDDPKLSGGMPIIYLAGNGKDRNVDMTPGALDVGETFAGVPTRLSVTRPDDMVFVTNKEMADPDHKTDFQIREIRVEGPYAEMFEVVDLAGKSLANRMLPAGEQVQVDVIFNPDGVGDFDATLAVYLDEDTTPQRPVPIHGRALYADAHGSGGCSTGRDTRGAMLFVVGVLLLVVRRRRR